MKTERITIEVPGNTTVKEVQEILMNVADMLGKNSPGQQITEVFDTLRNAARPKDTGTFFTGPTASA
ncbi:hypothetical protein [Chitinophaga barathri]|uniref:Uncharacterized protein n=1 Tax=Chitinophaga barathri TaxID=1647451 RepID=A0A3N4M8P0_9BACT|nr:hypothetical protein [Chitinophaga barathri]RPD37886.1 hypothetical protein EG028_27790 [Chitinophaga barathri]